MTEMEIRAIRLLEQCDSVQLASINDCGYPRICEMEKVKNNGLARIYFTTLKKSTKVKHFADNNKASVCYCVDGDSVSLVGEIEIIEDISVKKEIWQGDNERRFVEDEDGFPKYCILKFNSIEVTMFIDGEKKTLNLSNRQREHLLN